MTDQQMITTYKKRSNRTSSYLHHNTSHLGNYLIDRGALSIKSMFPNLTLFFNSVVFVTYCCRFPGIFYTCRVDNGGCSHLCEFDLLEMRQYCLCPDNRYSLMNLATCVLTTGMLELQIDITVILNLHFTLLFFFRVKYSKAYDDHSDDQEYGT